MYKIMIVEDDEGIAQSLSRQIASWDMEPRCVEDFHKVTQEFAAIDPQLVLLDIMLPFIMDTIGAAKSGGCPRCRSSFCPPLPIT